MPETIVVSGFVLLVIII